MNNQENITDANYSINAYEEAARFEGWSQHEESGVFFNDSEHGRLWADENITTWERLCESQKINIKTVETFLPAIQNVEVGADIKTRLRQKFLPSWARAAEIEVEAREIKVTDESQKDLMLKARELRLEMRQVRVDSKKLHDDLKSESLRTGKAIDAIYNTIKFLAEETEEHLRENEEFVMRKREAELDIIEDKRKLQLEKYKVDPTFYNLREMAKEGFETLISGIKSAYEEAQAKQEQAEKEAAEKQRLQEVFRKRFNEIRPVAHHFHKLEINDEELAGMSEKDFSALKTKLNKIEKAAIKEKEEARAREAKARAEAEAAKEEARKAQIQAKRQTTVAKRSRSKAKEIKQNAIVIDKTFNDDSEILKSMAESLKKVISQYEDTLKHEESIAVYVNAVSLIGDGIQVLEHGVESIKQQ